MSENEDVAAAPETPSTPATAMLKRRDALKRMAQFASGTAALAVVGGLLGPLSASGQSAVPRPKTLDRDFARPDYSSYSSYSVYASYNSYNSYHSYSSYNSYHGYDSYAYPVYGSFYDVLWI